MKIKDIISNICYIITLISGLVVIYIGVITEGDPFIKFIILIAGISLIIFVIASNYINEKTR